VPTRHAQEAQQELARPRVGRSCHRDARMMVDDLGSRITLSVVD